MIFFGMLAVFIFGAIIGSFLNVVIYRYNSSVSPLTGRSHCFACGKVLSPLELVPILSFLFSRGRCASCGVRISWQYPIVEALSGLSFLAVFLLNKPLAETVFLFAIFSVLIVIGVYDLRHQIIPDGLVAFFAILAVLRFLFDVGISNAFQFPFLWTLAAGPLLFLPFWVLWFVSQGRWLGLGDGKLALGIGWFLGMSLGATAIILAFWIGAGLALLMMGFQRIFKNSSFFRGKKLSMQSAIPFGPLLILSVFIVYFIHMNFFGLTGIFYLSL